jgi:NADPH:quinone reductase-like Zn-dependent oxidoreductase
MTALVAHERGGPERFAIETVPRPEPADDEVLVEVQAAAITFDELTWDETWSHLPTIPSHEVSGVVIDRGAAVSDLAPGDEVYGLIRFERNGGAAEYVTAPAGDLARRPRTVSHVLAAALPLAALTAWQALVDHAKVAPGEDVLVLGGLGGVGVFATQLAAHFGAVVTATIRSDRAEDARGLGAQHVVDVRSEPFDTIAARYDVVIDTVGGPSLDRSFAVLRPGGRLVTLQAPPDQARADEFGVQATFFVVAPDRGELEQLAALVDAGRLRIPVARTFGLVDGRAAFESRDNADRAPGKTVLVVRS